MGYTLIGTNDPINNPYTVFNLLSININYDNGHQNLKNCGKWYIWSCFKLESLS